MLPFKDDKLKNAEITPFQARFGYLLSRNGYVDISEEGGVAYGRKLHNIIYDNFIVIISINHKKITPTAK